MNWLIIENNIITNIIAADEEYAESIGAKPFYEGAEIGSKYNPNILFEKDLLDAVIEQGIKLKKLEMGLNNNVV